MNILLVDDNKELLDAWERNLSALLDNAHTFFKAITVLDASQILSEHTIHCIVADLKMPFLTGYDLIDKCAKDYPHIPIIVVSGYKYSTLEMGRRKNVIKSFEKPVSIKDLLDAITDAIGNTFIIAFHANDHTLANNRTKLDKLLLEETLKKCDCNKSQAAKLLNISRKHLDVLIKMHKIMCIE